MSFNKHLIGNNAKQSPVSNDDHFQSFANDSFHTDVRCKSDENIIKSLKRKYDDIEDSTREKQHCTGTQCSGVNSWIFDEKLKDAEVKDVLIALCDSCAQNLADECDSFITDENAKETDDYAKGSVQGSALAQIYSSESNKDDFHNTVSKHTFDTSTGCKSDEKIIKSLKQRFYDSEGGMCNPCASDVVGDYDSLTSDEQGSDKESTQNSRSVSAQTHSVSQNNIEDCRSRMMLNFNAIQNMHITESKKYPDKFLGRNASSNLIQSHLKSMEDHVNMKLENKTSETKPVSSDTSYFLQENLEPFGINSENLVKPDRNVSRCLSESSVLFGIGDSESNFTYLDNKKRTEFVKDIPKSLTTYPLEIFETLAFNENNEQLLKSNKACQSITKKTEYLPESPILCESSDSEPDFGYRNSKKHKPDFQKDLSESLAIYHLEDSETLAGNKNNEHVFKTNETSQSITMKTGNNIELDNRNSEVSSQDNKCISMVTFNVDAKIQHHKTDIKFANKESDSNFRSADETENENSNQGKIFRDPTADFANFGNMDRAIKERGIFEGNKEMQIPKEPQQFNTQDFTSNALSTEVHVNSSSSELIKMSNIQLQTVAEQSQRVTERESFFPLTSPFIQQNKRKRHHSAMPKTSPISPGCIQEIVKEYIENIKLREFTFHDVINYIKEKIPDVTFFKAVHESRAFFKNNVKKTLVFKNGKYSAACNTSDTFVAENSERNTTSERLTRTRNSLKKMTNHHQTEKSDDLIDQVNKNATVSSCMSPSGVSTDHFINESEKRNDRNNLNEHERETDFNKASNTTKRLDETRMIDLASEQKESS